MTQLDCLCEIWLDIIARFEKIIAQVAVQFWFCLFVNSGILFFDPQSFWASWYQFIYNGRAKEKIASHSSTKSNSKEWHSS